MSYCLLWSDRKRMIRVILEDNLEDPSVIAVDYSGSIVKEVLAG